VLNTARLSGGVLGFFVPLLFGLFIAGNGGAIKHGVLLCDNFSTLPEPCFIVPIFCIQFLLAE